MSSLPTLSKDMHASLVTHHKTSEDLKAYKARQALLAELSRTAVYHYTVWKRIA